MAYIIDRKPLGFLAVGDSSFYIQHARLDLPDVTRLFEPKYDWHPPIIMTRAIVRRINDVLNQKFGSSVRLVDGHVVDGSIRYQDGQLIIEGKFLQAAVVGISLVNGYATTVESIELILGQVHGAVTFASEQLGLDDFRTTFKDPRLVQRELDPFLPPERRLQPKTFDIRNRYDDLIEFE
ncbi:hypothetical protein [Rhizobium rhizophilum]|uniref:Uncharacterized protein n=1 Tax=Rhizobium rhizophilum TaxID=1850373 RepID=A0ABY2QTT7_9HYPH|nr:hypothetical protein [Rhizobium rhizophilum]THV13743.1 hypothetical protein E9677_12600 [Rhizobium rhizophilum]